MTGDITTGGAIFGKLGALGVDYVFVNSGTDFPPIIEGLAEAEAKGIDLPKSVVIPHEHAALGMAHGYYLISGKAQAVMLHTNVGLANGAIGAINAACEHVPVLMMSGRTPVMESDRFGARTVPIAWGQEMYDQTALVREASKWEYELRFPEQLSGLLDRSYAIANSTPKGPTYLTLPREVLCEPCPPDGLDQPTSLSPSRVAPDADALRAAAKWLAEAEAPLVIAQRGAGDEESFAQFSKWAEDWGIAVCSWWATHLAIPTDHPCHVGADPAEALAKADVVLVLDCLAPWWPDKHKLRDGAKVIQMGPDPLFSRFPVRNFPADLCIAGESADTVPALVEAMGSAPTGHAQRAKALGEANDKRRNTAAKGARDTMAAGLTKESVALVLGEALDGIKSTVFSELGVPLTHLKRDDHRSWFQEPHSGGLGWCFPAALGGQLAEPDRLCVATMGDGSYMFANPVACHQIAEAMELPVLIMVLNNREWGAVRHSVTGMYPDGYASKANRMPLTSLEPSPDFCSVAKASRAWTKSVSAADELRMAIDEAIAVCRKEKRCAFLEVMIR
ncbi:thiamine pyrophosphate-requiring protein [Qingshengfaniella alkalisoli]|uniref:Thiamine pyrophosphate-requiring protein n=1 Tax=Qingshengfaniella alkalisoli TaxID=2599296 RepID=A0A5B8J486_9RHOB|nr:thiamine pyrophosphate-requiring protein [Qingshengfaniella alkalisoli]QDY69080.1 thiamine pyrophosphate-requiring protein [Qingshengfaniella alkalisoli]